MPLKRVTITGADDNTDPKTMAELSERFPFVEWGILLSVIEHGTSRYPSEQWLTKLWAAHTPAMHVSLHFCDQFVRSYLTGQNIVKKELPKIWQIAGRFQLNFHGATIKSPASIAGMKFALIGEEGSYNPKPCIFQIDGVNDEWFTKAQEAGFNAMPLFDTSSGAGKVPSHWPTARFNQRNKDTAPLVSHGYAGGLGPKTLAINLPLIEKASIGARYWIDMEARVRGNWEGRDVLDLALVNDVLFQCEALINQ